MIYSESYKILINHHSHEIKEVFKNDFKYIYVVQITTKEKKFFLYEWHVEKGNEKNCNNCWFTSVVSSPIELIETIAEKSNKLEVINCYKTQFSIFEPKDLNNFEIEYYFKIYD